MNCRTQKLKNPGLLDSGTPMFEKQVWKKTRWEENCFRKLYILKNPIFRQSL